MPAAMRIADSATRGSSAEPGRDEQHEQQRARMARDPLRELRLRAGRIRGQRARRARPDGESAHEPGRDVRGAERHELAVGVDGFAVLGRERARHQDAFGEHEKRERDARPARAPARRAARSRAGGHRQSPTTSARDATTPRDGKSSARDATIATMHATSAAGARGANRPSSSSSAMSPRPRRRRGEVRLRTRERDVDDAQEERVARHRDAEQRPAAACRSAAAPRPPRSRSAPAWTEGRRRRRVRRGPRRSAMRPSSARAAPRASAARAGSPAASGIDDRAREKRDRRVGTDDDAAGRREQRIQDHRAERRVQPGLRAARPRARRTRAPTGSSRRTPTCPPTMSPRSAPRGYSRSCATPGSQRASERAMTHRRRRTSRAHITTRCATAARAFRWRGTRRDSSRSPRCAASRRRTASRQQRARSTIMRERRIGDDQRHELDTQMPGTTHAVEKHADAVDRASAFQLASAARRLAPSAADARSRPGTRRARAPTTSRRPPAARAARRTACRADERIAEARRNCSSVSVPPVAMNSSSLPPSTSDDANTASVMPATKNTPIVEQRAQVGAESLEEVRQLRRAAALLVPGGSEQADGEHRLHDVIANGPMNGTSAMSSSARIVREHEHHPRPAVLLEHVVRRAQPDVPCLPG